VRANRRRLAHIATIDVINAKCEALCRSQGSGRGYPVDAGIDDRGWGVRPSLAEAPEQRAARIKQRAHPAVAMADRAVLAGRRPGLPAAKNAAYRPPPRSGR